MTVLYGTLTVLGAGSHQNHLDSKGMWYKIIKQLYNRRGGDRGWASHTFALWDN